MKIINNVGDLVAVLSSYPEHLPVSYSMVSGGVPCKLNMKTDLQINQIVDENGNSSVDLSFIAGESAVFDSLSKVQFSFVRDVDAFNPKTCLNYAKELILLTDSAAELLAKNALVMGTSDLLLQGLYEYVKKQAREHFYVSTHLQSFEHRGAELSAQFLFAIYAIDKLKANIYVKTGVAKFDPLAELSHLDGYFFEIELPDSPVTEIEMAKGQISNYIRHVESFTILPYVRKDVLRKLSVNLALMAYHSKDVAQSMKTVEGFLDKVMSTEEMSSAVEFAKNSCEF